MSEENYPMTLKEVANYSRFAERTIQYHTHLGNLIGHRPKGGRHFRWYKSDVDAWLRSEPVAEAS